MPSFTRDLRAFCRPPMGAEVSFAGVSRYPDGEPVFGLFDRPVAMKLMNENIGGVESALPELRLPFDAFETMPQGGDVVTVDGTIYTVQQPTAEDDGAFLCYELKKAS